MSNNLKDTQPSLLKDETQPTLAKPGVIKKFSGWWVLIIVLILLVLGVLGGYGAGINRRYAAQNTQLVGQLQEQFQLGLQAMDANKLILAEKYFRYIIEQDSNFPGIQTAYSDLLIKMQVSPTPVFSPTPVVTPTPDLRGAEEIFKTAQQLLNSSDWDGAITNLDSLRKLAPSYRTVDIDGMYYMALRQRGVIKITAACKDTNLEGGIYDLTLAEQFVGVGNLDSVAQSLRTYARLYVIGASFWDQDWVQAQKFFGQVKDGYPYMTDSSCIPASKRWYQATIKYAEQLLAAGDNCGASNQYASAFTVDNPFSPTVYPTATAVYRDCHSGDVHPPTATTTGITSTPSDTPSGVKTKRPTKTPTVVPTDTPVPTPTDTPTQTTP